MMDDVANDVERWFDEGKSVAVAQVVRTWGSSPRVAGSIAAVSDDGHISGSVSGGCVEGETIRLALEVLDDGRARMGLFHASTREARGVGLSCGGSVDVLVSVLDRAQFDVERSLVERDEEYVRATAWSPESEEDGVQVGLCSTFVLVEGESSGACGKIVLEPDGGAEDALRSRVSEASAAMASTERSSRVEAGDGTVVFLARRWPRPRLVCVGGVHIAVHLARIAKQLGFATVVVDPRRVFSTKERFPDVDALVQLWPQEAFSRIPITSQTAVCALTHDPKIDVPALRAALDSPAFYIGSLGRLSTQRQRAHQLLDGGASLADVNRVFGPIGLDLGGRGPEEVALAIMAQIVAVRHGSKGVKSTTMLQSARADDPRKSLGRKA